MNYAESNVAPAIQTDADEELLDYGVDTAKRMVGMVTHDFNNLIAVVRGYAAVLQGHTLLDEDSKGIAGLIEQAGSELSGLTERMARFAEARANGLARLNLNTVVEEFIQHCSGATPEGIEVRVRLSDSLPGLLGDSNLIREAFYSIWQNSIDAMPHGGRLTWETKALDAGQANRPGCCADGPSAYVCLQVSDTGGGMDEQTRRQIFAPFFTTKSGKGRGLGATVMYNIVRSHGGHIQVSSSLGMGTSVALYFPAAADAGD